MEYVVLIGRALFSVLFIASGFNHFKNRAGTVAYAKAMKAPLPEVTVPLTGAMLVAGGLSVLLGYQAEIGAWLLVVFLLPAAFTMHKFWGLSDPMQAANQQAHFFKNLALAGAALLLAYFGSGPFSLSR